MRVTGSAATGSTLCFLTLFTFAAMANPHFGSQTYTSLNAEKRTVSTNWVFRAQPIPYDWAPEGTPRSEKGVAPIDIKNYRVQ